MALFFSRSRISGTSVFDPAFVTMQKTAIESADVPDSSNKGQFDRAFVVAAAPLANRMPMTRNLHIPRFPKQQNLPSKQLDWESHA